MQPTATPPPRRRSESTLRDEEFRLLVEGVKDYAIFMLDPQGRVMSWNAGAERIKGYRADEIIGRSFTTFYTEDAVASGHPAHELEIAAAEGRYEEEGWRVRKDGSRFWANVLITALSGDDGSLRGFAKVTRDFTERRAAQDALRESEARLRVLAGELERRVEERTRELRDAYAELEAFSYSVSHDLRAPLRAIDGFSKLLAAGADAKLDDVERAHLARIRDGAQRMSRLIDDLLQLSRLSRAPLSLQDVDVSAVAAAVVDELRQVEPDRVVDVAVEPGMRARADGRLLHLLLQNLIGNAWKFTRRRVDGRIEVGTTTMRGTPAFFVKDDGAGFDMRYAAKLFVPFERLHSAREYEGTGIGLASVKRVVARHGGAVEAVGAPDQGATFTFTLEPPR